MSLSTSIVSYYKFDETSGNASDSVGSNTLTNNGTVTYSSGKINNGINTASGKFMNRSSVLSASTANVGVSMWVNLSGASLSGAFFHNGTGPNNGWGVGVGNIQYDGAGGLGNHVILLIDAVAWRNTSENIGTGWHHIVVTRGATTWKIYIDSVLSVNTFTDTPITPASNLDVGRDVGQSAPFTGMIDELGYWNRELLQADVTALYNGGTGIQYPFLSGNSNFFLFF